MTIYLHHCAHCRQLIHSQAQTGQYGLCLRCWKKSWNS
jgi:hypothetical protein